MEGDGLVREVHLRYINKVSREVRGLLVVLFISPPRVEIFICSQYTLFDLRIFIVKRKLPKIGIAFR